MHGKKKKKTPLAIQVLIHGLDLSSLSGVVDLFSDGSCASPHYGNLSLAGWSVVSASHHCTLASGPLAGVEQSVNRAELTAALVALQWAVAHRQDTVLWTDSAYVAQHFWQLQGSLAVVPGTHGDLWAEVRDGLSVHEGSFRVVHVAAHQELSDSMPEADWWAAYWNSRADEAAANGRALRTSHFWEVWAQYAEVERQQIRDIGLFRALHLEVAEARCVMLDIHWVEDDDDEIEVTEVFTAVSDSQILIANLPQNWGELLDTAPALDSWCKQFLRAFLQWQLGNFTQEATHCMVSWLEIVFLLHANGIADFPHPIAGPSGTRWVSNFEAPQVSHVSCTVAALIRCLRDALIALSLAYHMPLGEAQDISLGNWGVTFRLRGIPLLITGQELRAARASLRIFTARRPVRVINDLSRPLLR